MYLQQPKMHINVYELKKNVKDKVGFVLIVKDKIKRLWALNQKNVIGL